MVGTPIGSLISVILLLFLTPIFHLSKTWIYHLLSVEGEEKAASITAPSILSDIKTYIRIEGWMRLKSGFREIKLFLLDFMNVPFHVLSTVFLVLGVIIGRRISQDGLSSLIFSLGYEMGRINPDFLEQVTPFIGIDLFFHNWQVSLSIIVSGFFLLVPVPMVLFTNGFILGIVNEITPSSTMLLAAILPHGIIEIPAFILAGSCGLKLGFNVIKALLGKDSNQEGLRIALRQAVYVALGLIPLFLIAGFIEAMVTPTVMKMFGWI
jgi:uncharacterized membrane protein SpoIIM required for sporulation